MKAVHNRLRRGFAGIGSQGNRHAVFVRAADEDHVAADPMVVANEEVGGKVGSGELTDVERAIGVGQRTGYKNLLFFIFVSFARQSNSRVLNAISIYRNQRNSTISRPVPSLGYYSSHCDTITQKMGNVSPVSILIIIAVSLLLAGCEQPVAESASLTAGEAETVSNEVLPQPYSIPTRLDDQLVWEVFATTKGEPRYLGRESFRRNGDCWSSEYNLESGSGLTLGCENNGLNILESRPAVGEPRRMLPGSLLSAKTWRYQAVTDGPGLGALAVLLSRLELAPATSYRLTAFDLRQQLAYELTLRIGQVELVSTNWGERLCRSVKLTPLGITAYLDEDGQTWLFRWAEGYAERRLSN